MKGNRKGPVPSDRSKTLVLWVGTLVCFAGALIIEEDWWAIPLFIIALILLFWLGALGVAKDDRQRTKKFKDLAEQMGMEFSEKGDSALLGSLGAFDLFRRVNRGSRALRLKKITNVLDGDSEQLGYSEEFKVTILRCWYQEGWSSSGRNSIFQTVICFGSPQLSLPNFLMRPEKLHCKIGSALGYQDIDFESDRTGAEFSKKCLLRGKDEQKIRVLFTDKILTFFAVHPDEVCVEGSGDQLILYRNGKLIKPENTPAFMEEGLEVFRLFTSPRPRRRQLVPPWHPATPSTVLRVLSCGPEWGGAE